MKSDVLTGKLLSQIVDIAKANDNIVSKTIVEDLLKESHAPNYDEAREKMFADLERAGITVDPSENDEGYSENQLKDPKGRFVPADVNIRPRSMSMDQILARLKYKEIDLQPGFQRKRDLWDHVMQSRLIESLLLKIPLPAFYFDARDDDKWIVIDGLQRLTAFEHFFQDSSFILSGLEYMTEMNNKRFEDLPRQYVRRILESSITVYTVERGTPEEVVYNIFKRINTGGLGLEPQEIRHALYQGKATELAEKLAESKSFKVATGGAISSSRMLDCEYVTRFFAFTQLDYIEDYEDSIDDFLIKAMKRVNMYSEEDIRRMENRFYLTMDTCHEIFGLYTFRRISPKRRGPINKAIFELWSACLYDLVEDKRKILLEKRNRIFDEFRGMLEDDTFSGWIKNGDKPSMVNRINNTKHMLERIIYD